jgi:hypothetical protein
VLLDRAGSCCVVGCGEHRSCLDLREQDRAARDAVSLDAIQRGARIQRLGGGCEHGVRSLMSLSDRVRAKALEAAEKAKAAAAENAGRAVSHVRTAIDERTDGAGPRLLALLRMEDDQPITIEAMVVLLVDAVRKDGETRELSDRDVRKAAKRRYRRLGTVALPTGPLGWHLVELYCEAATLCDIVELRRSPLSDEQVAVHLLVLWGAMPDVPAAAAAFEGTGPSVLATLLGRARDRVKLPPSGEMTKRSVVVALWSLRGTLDDAREIATPGVRGNLFPGARVKAFIAEAGRQLDGERPAG